MTMHWASPKKEAMLEPAKSLSPDKPTSSSAGTTQRKLKRDSRGSRSFDETISESVKERQEELKEGTSDDLSLLNQDLAAKSSEATGLSEARKKPAQQWAGTPSPPGSLLHKFRTYQI